MRVYFSNLGCKLNQAELEKLARDFTSAGHRVVGSLEAADLHVVNSCTVTCAAARDSRKTARRGGRRNPRLRTVVTGCWASERPAEAGELPGVDLVVTNDRKEHLLALVEERFGGGEGERGAGGVPVPYVPLAFGNTRSLVKVEDGCNMRCAFCIIPTTRGRQRSRAVPEVVAEVAGLVEAGAQEVVVTGVQISHYRWQGRTLPDLVEVLLRETRVPRLRLTSIAPWRFDDRLLELFGDRRLCRHVHLSLQSGSTATLERMRRPYTAAAYAALVERLRRAVPGIAVTTDVIVGFPGETESELAESLRFVESMAFAKLHAFPYSVREGTEAASLPGQVPHGEKRRRMAAMLELGERLERRFQEEHLGARLEVLWEERRQGVWQGTSDNYLRVLAATGAPAGNTLAEVEIAGLAEGGLWGRPVEPQPAPARSRLPIVGG